MSMAERGPGGSAELSSASTATTAKGTILVRVEPRAKGLGDPTRATTKRAALGTEVWANERSAAARSRAIAGTREVSTRTNY